VSKINAGLLMVWIARNPLGHLSQKYKIKKAEPPLRRLCFFYFYCTKPGLALESPAGKASQSQQSEAHKQQGRWLGDIGQHVLGAITIKI